MKTIDNVAKEMMINVIEENKGDIKMSRMKHYLNYIELIECLHDAINSPKGVVPESAEKFYCQDYYE